MSSYFLEVKDLKKHFPVVGGIFKRQKASVQAVDGVSFGVKKGETVGLVGESGCGKTTLGRTLLRLYDPTSGHIFFKEKDITSIPKKKMRGLRREMQMIFQDPFESLNARHTIQTILEEPYIVHKVGNKSERIDRVDELLQTVGLPPSAKNRFPHEFSGGQRQRIGIARAIALSPELVVCDEPVSALDVSIQSQILNLLLELQERMALTYIFIAHDLSVVRHISDRVIVMYLGHIVESVKAEDIDKNPLHPYTKSLIAAIPIPDPTLRKKKEILTGEVPSPISPPKGCVFHTRCPLAESQCRNETPHLRDHGTSTPHWVACHLTE